MERSPFDASVWGLLRSFARIQVNHGSPDVSAVRDFGASLRTRCIVQTRDRIFPGDDSIDWLFDRSSGRGVAPSAWTVNPGRLAGYAGGIGPSNVRRVIETTQSASDDWIDMESQVRTAERFDVGLCEQVCRQVYGRGGVLGGRKKSFTEPLPLGHATFCWMPFVFR